MKPFDPSIWPSLRSAAEKALTALGKPKLDDGNDSLLSLKRNLKQVLFAGLATVAALVVSLTGLGLAAPTAGVAALGGIAMIAWLCGHIEKRLWTNPNLFLFALAPVPERTVFKRMLRPVARSLWPLVFPVWALIAPLEEERWFSNEPLLVSGSLALAATAALISAAFTLVATGRAGAFKRVVVAIGVLTFVTHLVPGGKALVLGLLTWSEPVLRYLCPTGWAGIVFQSRGAGSIAWMWLLPLAAMAGSILWSLRRAQARFRFREPYLEALGVAPDLVDDDGLEEKSARRNDTTTVREQVLSGNFLRSEETDQRAPVDRLIHGLFTPRERLLARWARPEPLRYGASWKLGSLCLAAGFLLGWLGHWVGWKHYLIAWAAGGLAGGVSLVLRTSSGIRAYSLNGMGQGIGLHLFPPMHLGELWRMEWKIFLGRWLAAVVPVAAFGAAVAAVEGFHPLLGADYAARVAACALPVALLSQASMISATVRIAPGWRKVTGFAVISFLILAGIATGIIAAAIPAFGWIFVVLSAASFQGTISAYLWMAYGPSGSFAVDAKPAAIEGI